MPGPELIVRARAGAAARLEAAAPTGAGGRLEPLFAAPAGAAAGGPEADDLARWFRAVGTPGPLEAAAAALRRLDAVDAAYLKPATELPGGVNGMGPVADGPGGATPDLTPRQGYLDPAPAGVDARHAWGVPGGDGAGVQIIDVEGAWRFSHEELRGRGGLIGGVEHPSRDWRNHGTAVLGVLAGAAGEGGITGICPAARARAISLLRPDGGENAPGAIREAALALAPGDILLLEMHRPGPRSTGGEEGLIPVEWWPDDHAAIRAATDRGVVVVAAAGNGWEDLDDPAYDVPAEGFPPDWSNPLRRGAHDSGAILVGAGAPPPRTHGRNLWGPDRSRLLFSNHGSAVDAQGWGREVTTCGYGDLQGGGSEDAWYTDRFGGTSSAAPIVAGALACLQGVRRARGQAPATPAQAREPLRATGTPQEDAHLRPRTQRIGNRPDLRRLLAEED